jgi:hypothetical protein
MPSVAQVSMPSSRTALIIVGDLRQLLRLRAAYAAPMQKRVAPFARAMRALATTSSTSSSGSDFRPVSKRMLCEQYAQSSGQAPVLIDSSVLT